MNPESLPLGLCSNLFLCPGLSQQIIHEKEFPVLQILDLCSVGHWPRERRNNCYKWFLLFLKDLFFNIIQTKLPGPSI